MLRHNPVFQNNRESVLPKVSANRDSISENI